MSLFQLRAYRKKEDEELVLLFQEKQENICLRILYERYGRLVYGVVLKYFKNADDAHDMASVVFEQLGVKILKSEIRHFKSWLHMVTRNSCLMELRKKKPHFEREHQDLLADEGDKIEEKTNEEAQFSLLEKNIDLLKEDQKRCIKAFYIEEKSYQEIAFDLAMDIKTVKSNIQNGKRNLKIKLEQDHEFKRAI